ncbi:MAG TPA: class I SAM-dependent methyltransferase [Chitinophagaceae bacterium]
MNDHADTMERIVPDLMDRNDAAARISLKLHEERYAFACRYLIPGRVLDIACGTGYGTNMLSQYSDQECTGVDISADAISYALKRYAHPRTRFIREDLMKFKDEKQFENIVSLETIEHLPEPEKVVAHLNELLRPGGQLIVSAPVTPSTDGNPYHVNDFTARSFRALFLQQGFKELACLEQKQPFTFKEVANRKKQLPGETRRGILQYYLNNPSKFFGRIRSLIIDGFNNRYLVLVLRKGS